MTDNEKGVYKVCILGPEREAFRHHFEINGFDFSKVTTLTDGKGDQHRFIFTTKKRKADESTHLVLICIPYNNASKHMDLVKSLFDLVAVETSAKIYICMSKRGPQWGLTHLFEPPLFCLNSQADNVYEPIEHFLSYVTGKDVRRLRNYESELTFAYHPTCIEKRKIYTQFTRV